MCQRTLNWFTKVPRNRGRESRREEGKKGCERAARDKYEVNKSTDKEKSGDKKGDLEKGHGEPQGAGMMKKKRYKGEKGGEEEP